jgi:hypothetical protein
VPNLNDKPVPVWTKEKFDRLQHIDLTAGICDAEDDKADEDEPNANVCWPDHRQRY